MDVLKLIPKNQKKIFHYKKILLEIIGLYKEKKIPNKILFSGPKGIGKSTLSYHLINYILSINEDFKYDLDNLTINELNKSYNLVLNNSHPNFHLINVLNDKKTIDILQIRKMINYANKSSFNNREKIILIDNVEKLNLNSLNALLKIVEEPSDKILFILIFDNNKKILNTLKSRCIKFNLSLTFDESINITNKILNNDLYSIINKDLINHYSTPGDLINLLKFSLTSKLDLTNIDLRNFLFTLIDKKFFKDNIFINNNIYKFIEFYLLNLMIKNKSNNKVYSLYNNFIHKVYNLKTFNLDEEVFFIDFKSKILNE